MVAFFDLQFLYIIILCIIEILGDFSIKKYVETNLSGYLGGGIVFYGGVIYFLIKSLQGSTILLVNILWDGISALLETLAAMFFLGERMENGIQYLGILTIILGIFMVKYKEEHFTLKKGKLE